MNWNGSGKTVASAYVAGVAYGNGIWVATTYNDPPYYSIAYSSDGKTWTSVPTAFFGTSVGYAVAYYNGLFVLSGAGNYRMVYSTNGINWAYTVQAFANVNGIAHNGIHWVATGSSGNAYYSDDGITWTTVSTPLSTGYGIASANVLPLTE